MSHDLLGSFIMIRRTGDQTDLVGNTHESVERGLGNVSKTMGIPVASLRPTAVVIECPGLPPVGCIRVDYEGYLGSGGPRDSPASPEAATHSKC